MNDPKLSSTGLGALAVLVAHLREDWQPPGIRTALDTAAARPVTGYDLAHAALTAAANPAVRTPAVIAMDGQHWHTPEPTEPKHRSYETPYCPRCRCHYTDGKHHTESCEPGNPHPASPTARAAARRVFTEALKRRRLQREAGNAHHRADAGQNPPAIATSDKLAGEHRPTRTPTPPGPQNRSHGERSPA